MTISINGSPANATSIAEIVADLGLTGAVNQTELITRYGFGRYARNTLNTVSMWSDDYIGTYGAGGTDFFPRSITASQSGTTVTATTTVFEKLYVGARIIWDSGEEAVITAVDNSGSGWSAITTCTVDRSQTVSSSAATICQKHLIGLTYGDSAGNRISPLLQKLLYRTYGFGGYVIHANNVEENFGSQIAVVPLAGGAADATNDSLFADYPWGAVWTVPSAGTITFSLQNTFSNGVAREYRHGLEPSERKHDTAVLVWRRGAGAFTVERKRYWDAQWEAVTTVADASTGSTSFNHLKFSHDLGSDWEYRITSTSGTINVVSMTFRNDSQPGYIHWPLSRGGEFVSDFDQLSSAELAELAIIQGQPDFRCVMAFDTIPGTTTSATYKATLDTDRALWQAACPRTDHIWFTGWDANVEQSEQAAWIAAVKQVALANGDGLVALDELFGDFTTQGSAIGWVQDSVHPSIKGEAIIGHEFLRVTGLDQFPTAREGRDVNARRGDFASLYVLGDDLAARVRKAEQPYFSDGRGATWNSTLGAPVCSIGGALGTADFTISLDLTVPATVLATNYACIGTSGRSAAQNGGLVVFQDGPLLRIELRDGSGNTIDYRFAQFGTILGGKTGNLMIRSDVANARFDLFWDGKPIPGLVGTITGTTTLPLGTWSGTGTEFGIPQGTVSGRQTDIYGAMLWRSRLTDAEIQAVAYAGQLQTTTPDFFWDFSEGIGRITRDKSGNLRDGQWFNSGPSEYNIGVGPTWKYPKRGVLGPVWNAGLNAVTVLLNGDNVIAAYSASRDLLLPTTAAIGEIIKVTVNSASTIRITQNASQQIKSGASATTAGTGGSLTIPNASSVTLRCVAADTTWIIEEVAGAALTFT